MLVVNHNVNEEKSSLLECFTIPPQQLLQNSFPIKLRLILPLFESTSGVGIVYQPLSLRQPRMLDKPSTPHPVKLDEKLGMPSPPLGSLEFSQRSYSNIHCKVNRREELECLILYTIHKRYEFWGRKIFVLRMTGCDRLLNSPRGTQLEPGQTIGVSPKGGERGLGRFDH